MRIRTGFGRRAPSLTFSKGTMTAKDTRQLAIGTYVFCTVHAVRGWYRVLAIRSRDGFIKISGFNTWNPPHNFRTTDEEGRYNP